MKPYYEDPWVRLFHGDCLEVLRSLPDASVDSVVTDPPYGLEFMGKDWDAPWKASGTVLHDPSEVGGFQDGNGGNAFSRSRVRYGREGGDSRSFGEWCELWATECLRVLKPGGHLLAFGGTRTWHRLACAVEDAGFEVRDSIAWLYGSGFPKSLDVSKAIERRDFAATPDAERWQGWGTALKPAFEPIVVARKPLSGTVAATVLAHGTGALNIDACRISTDEDRSRPPRTPNAILGNGKGTNLTASESNPAGRWPTNVVLDESQAEVLDEMSGERTSGGSEHDRSHAHAGIYGAPGGDRETRRAPDSGGASRFFPTFRYEAKAPSSERPRIDGIAHPTVKPLDLMRWLVRLVTPPGGTVLEPFAGSGTTVEACVVEGFKCVAIEREADYLPLVIQRINRRRDPVQALRQIGQDLGLFEEPA